MKSRYNVLDAIRGFALVNMIIYHCLWDMVYIFGYDITWFKSITAYIWQQCICITFILLSGFCSSFSKHKFKRGLIVFVAGILVTVVTLIALPENPIIFGVLTLIGSSMLIVALFDKYLYKINPKVGFILFLLLFLLFRNVNNGYLGFYGIKIFKIPNSLYRNLFTAYLGFPDYNFISSDYFSLIPWLFLFIVGYYLEKIIVDKAGLYKTTNIYLEYLGRHSLLIYLLHQPLLYVMLLLVS